MKRLLVVPIALISCFIVGCQNDDVLERLAQLESMKAVAQIEEQNKDIVRDVFAAIDAGDFDKLSGLLSDSFVLVGPDSPEPLGKDALFQLIKTHYTAFPDWKHVIENVVADGDKVAVKLNQNGTHQAEYEGIPATEVKATLPAMHLITVVDGRAVDWFAIEDYLGLYTQLGMELKPKEGEE